MPEAPIFHEEKLAELMLHIASRLQDDPTFGATKLNKVLYYADFIHYAEYGSPITGATYRKLNYGPVPKELPSVQRHLVDDEDDAELQENMRLGLRQKRLIPKRPANTALFSESELDVVDGIIEALEGRTAGEVSAMSHLEPGWRLASMFEEIPYYTVFLMKPTLTEDDMRWGKKLADERGYQSVS